MIYLEYVVLGPPVTNQATNRANLKAWQSKVIAEIKKVWLKPPLTGKLKTTIINFYDGPNPPLDLDNMSKPIHDAMNNLVYLDDRQVRTTELVHFCIDDPIKIRKAPAILLACYSVGDEFLYVRIEDAPDTFQLPQ